ncbi:MAG: alginate lyase family protein [Kiritimatiellia bacterium]
MKSVNLQKSNRIFVSEDRLQTLREQVAAQAAPVYEAWCQLKTLADNDLDRIPDVPAHWHVPWYYVDAKGHETAKNGMRDEANLTYALALCARVTGENRYAKTAIRMLDGWVSGIQTMSMEEDSTLAFCCHFVPFILAADLLRDEGDWTEEAQSAFEDFLRDRALPMNTMSHDNNWGNWGLALASACAAYLRDEPLRDRCITRWRTFIEAQIAEDGHLPHEVNRNEGRHGIWYSHFSLLPQTIAAELLRGEDFDPYSYTSPSGRSLRQACLKLAAWVEHPETFHYWKADPSRLVAVDYFSYFEILNPHWQEDILTRLLQKKRPLSALHGAPYLTFTHGL